MPVPVFSTGEVLTAANMNAVGLWRITGCTVTSAGGTAATASNGVITVGTNNTSLTISSAFSSDFTNYRIVINGITGSAVGDMSLKFGAAVTNYAYGMVYSTTTAPTAAVLIQANTTSFLYVAGHSTSPTNTSIEVFQPNLAKPTGVLSHYSRLDATGPAYVTGHYTGLLNDTTQYTSFILTPGAGNLTGGTIRVYGYRN